MWYNTRYNIITYAYLPAGIAYYLMERGEYEEARLQLQQVVEYQKDVGPGILLLLAECSVMEDGDESAYENFVTAIVNTEVAIADLMRWHLRIFPSKLDVGGLIRMCGAVLLEYAITKRTVTESSDDTQYCVDTLRHFLLSLEDIVHQLLFKPGNRKSNFSSFILYIISKTHSDLKEHNDECVVDDVLRECVVARVHYLTGDFARSWQVTESGIQTILKYDAQATKFNAYGRLLCWKANLYLLHGNVKESIPLFQSSIAALEVATDFCTPEEQSKQLVKAVKCRRAALQCQRSRR